MAIFATPVNSDLIILVQTGTDAEGNPVYDRVRYSALKPGATDQDAYDVAAAIGGAAAAPRGGDPAAERDQPGQRLSAAGWLKPDSAAGEGGEE